MKLSADVKAFEDRLGHTFRRPGLLINALTHASYASHQRQDNERLEFLGDRVLGLVMAEALLELDNVTLLPHLGTAALDVRTTMGLMAVANLKAVLVDGIVPPNAVGG